MITPNPHTNTSNRRSARSWAAGLGALSLSAALVLTGCGAAAVNGTAASANTAVTSTAGARSVADLEEATHYDADDTEYAEEDVTEIALQGDTASVDGADVDTVSISDDDGEALVTITGTGTYRLSGELSGRVVVESDAEDAVKLIFDGVTITSSQGAALAITAADEVTVMLTEGTENALTDAASYADTSDDAPDAALFSRADLSLVGAGALTVTGNVADAIHSNDGLVIDGVDLTVEAADDGIVGKDYLVLLDGTVDVTAADDGFKATNDEDVERGWLAIFGGELTVSAGDDGVKAETTLQIQDGTVTVTESEEGIEAYEMLISGGALDISANDDAINASGELASGTTEETTEENAMLGGGMPEGGMGGMEAAGGQRVSISGGTVTLNAGGDGLDSNGDAEISGGTVVVNGPENDGNGALDFAGTFTVTGGDLAAAGSSGMAQGPGEESTQSGIQATFTTVPAGTTLLVADAEGTVVAQFTTSSQVANLVLSGDYIDDGAEYTVYQAAEAADTAGLVVGDDLDGSASVDGATELATVTAGEYQAGMGMGGGPGQMGEAPSEMGGQMGGPGQMGEPMTRTDEADTPTETS